MYVDDINLAGKKHNIDPLWKVLNKEVDLGEPTSFLDHVYLSCTRRNGICRRIVKSLLTDCSENACIWPVLIDLIFNGP